MEIFKIFTEIQIESMQTDSRVGRSKLIQTNTTEPDFDEMNFGSSQEKFDVKPRPKENTKNNGGQVVIVGGGGGGGGGGKRRSLCRKMSP